MAKQNILWTVLPYGTVDEGELAGRRRVTVVVSPRLTPESAGEQTLAAFAEFLDWPGTLAGARFEITTAGTTIPLIPLGLGDSVLWQKLFSDQTPVAGFAFRDMSKVNLRSYSVRNVLGFLRQHYGQLAVQSASNHPTLLPWKDAHPDLKGMLTGLGTRTYRYTVSDRHIEVALPGFDRFFDDSREGLEQKLGQTVYSDEGIYKMDVAGVGAEDDGDPPVVGKAPRRVLPSDWTNPRPGGPGTPLSGAPDAALMDQFASAAEYAFYQASRFYRREPPSKAQQAMRRPTYADIPDGPKVPDFDFHRIVASYADMPLLLRALGLVFDCAIDDDTVIDDAIANGGGAAKGAMALRIDWSNDHNSNDDTTPRTAWQADKERFYARPHGTDSQRGLLRLDHSDDGWNTTPKEHQGLFDLYQVDPDGATHKTVGFTLSAQNLVAKSLSLRQVDGEVTYTTGDRQAVAALRSGGLGVARHGRAHQVAKHAAAAALKNQAVETGNGDQVMFFSEDLLRGYRVDVAAVPTADDPGRWHTLCARAGKYRLIESGEVLELGTDEGYVSGASTTSTASEGVNPDDHYLHESLFRWTGWSLCAPRPGLMLRARTVPGTQMQSEEHTDTLEEAANGNGVAATFKAPKGTLPRLRFGQLYRFRARLVDLAGNSLQLDDPSLGEFENASDAVGYWRFEPIDPPAIVQRHRVSEGESLERVVIRSNYDADPASYLSTPDFAAAIALPESQDFEYTETGERHFVPPKSAQQQCEQHGMFDPYLGDPQQIKDGYEIAAREAGTLFDTTPGAQVELVTPAAVDQVATTSTVPPELPSADNPVGDRLTGGQYLIHREARVETPYLPDPASAGVALRAQPGHSLPGVDAEVVLGPSCAVRRAPNDELVLLVSNANDWPDSQGFRLILAERKATLQELPCNENFDNPGAPVWDETERTLTLFVAKGRIVRLLYASFAHPALIDTFGVPHWTQNDAQRDFVAGMAQHGCSWMLTPFRRLQLVHATQQPICLPELVKMAVHRPEGAQYANLICRLVRLHGPSTGKFEIEAHWYEWVDDINKEGPERVEHKGQLGEILLNENHVNQFSLSTAVAEQTVDPERPRARPDRHELGDTRFRLVEYRVRATTRFREYLPPALYADSDKVTRLGPIATGPGVQHGAADDPGAPVIDDPAGSEDQLIVPASAAPDDPRVLYVVPTFLWQQTQSGGTKQVVRHGNGLRVWLDRPWFSSGDGELLGVIIYGENARFTDVPARMQPLVTQWGLDPLWDTMLPKNQTRMADFPARVQVQTTRLQERPEDDFVRVVGHRVHWDAQRSLWYSDIALEPGASYMPFVRLALVRFQPHALPGASISKVVLAEFAQVLPRRRATLDREGNNINLGLYGTAPSYGPMKFPVDSEYADVSFQLGDHETGRNRVELVLQTRNPQMDSDLAWRDVKTLGQKIVGPSDNDDVAIPGVRPGGIFARTARTAATSRTVDIVAGSRIRLDAAVDRTGSGSITAVAAGPVQLMEPKLWSFSAEVPSTGSNPARLMLREFERYYTDRTVPERSGSTTHQRRVIEERLVYATVFDLND